MTALELGLAADPLLAWRPRVATPEQREVIQSMLTGLGALLLELSEEEREALLLELSGQDVALAPDEQYAVLCVLELNHLAQGGPNGVDLVALACERERLLEPHDDPGQAELRAVVTLEWLRARLGTGSTN